MVTLAGIAASQHQNEKVGAPPLPTDYYVAHLLLVPDEPGPDNVTPFYFVSVDLCELAPYLQLLLDTAPSAHGYTRHFHRYNYSAALLHRFSYFLATCYAKNFDRAYADKIGKYPAKIVYVPPRIPIKLLEQLSQAAVPPIVIAGTSECEKHARGLGFPCSLIGNTTAEWLNREIGSCFSKPAVPLTAEQKNRLDQGQFKGHIPPNVFVSTFPDESLFGESKLKPFPTSGMRLLLPNEVLNNQMRRRWMPPPSQTRPDPAENLERELSSMRIAFAQRLADYLLIDPRHGLADGTLGPGLRSRLEEYLVANSADAFETLVAEAAKHLAEYPGACDYVLCCPAINKRSSERIFRRTVPDRILNHVYKAKAQDFQTYFRPQDFRSEQEFQDFMSLMIYQSLENNYLSTVLSLYAASSRQPILRTPQLSSGLFGMLRQLRRTYAGRNWHAFQRDLEKFSNAVLNELSHPVRDFLKSTRSEGVKLISDLPMEWLPIDGVPIMFQRTLSRLPLTPGNALYSSFNACREDLRIGPKEAQRILVCNCLSPGDDLYGYPKLFVKGLEGIGVQHSYVEPKGTKEYAAALLSHKPYFLVHWGHGFYDQAQERGYLAIRDERTEIWDLTGCSIPPIVLLAACDTAAIAETYNTPANGWLALGARSVLASYFPIQADLTTVLFGRIFANLLEAVHGKQILPTWEIVVSRTLLLNRYLDFFYGFVEWSKRRHLEVPPRGISLEYTYLWNKQRWSPAEGYRRCPELLARAMDRQGKKFGDHFRRYLREETTVPHTMFFAHLGAPETIRISKERRTALRSRIGKCENHRMHRLMIDVVSTTHLHL
jgi:hypothetical protein